MKNDFNAKIQIIINNTNNGSKAWERHYFSHSYCKLCAAKEKRQEDRFTFWVLRQFVLSHFEDIYILYSQ